MFAKNLKFLREKNAMEQLELARRLGKKSSSSVSEWEKGKYTPKMGVINDIAEIFNVSISDLMDADLSTDIMPLLSLVTSTTAKLEEPRQKNVLSYAEQQLEEQLEKQKKNKLISMEEKRREKERFSQNRKGEKRGAVGAGIGVNNFYDDASKIEDHEWPMIPIPDDTPYDFDWVYTASGDSMKPKYEDGDIVYAKELDDYDRSNLSTDEIYVVRVGEDSFLKKIRISEDGLYLVSLNKKYEDIRVCENEYVKVVAKVVN